MQNEQTHETAEEYRVSDSERQLFHDVVSVFHGYSHQCLSRIDKSRSFVDQMKSDHKKRLSSYLDHLKDCQLAIEHNQSVLNRIVHLDNGKVFENAVPLFDSSTDAQDKKVDRQCTIERSRIFSVLNQIVREWSSAGEEERRLCYGPIVDAINTYFGNSENKAHIQILVPGSGLGRLVYDLVCQGYSAEGNEFSPMMLFTANFILNKCNGPNAHYFYPWVTHFSNVLRTSDHLRRINFPDVNPKNIPKDVNFSMAAGAFDKTYHTREWHCVATCFFLDTAPNVIEYVEKISQIILRNGIWVNIGPLYYHYADVPNESSIEPSYEMLREIIMSYGFEFLDEKLNVETHYTQNADAMLSYVYKSVYFVCRKL